jgi:hypothetical protein
MKCCMIKVLRFWVACEYQEEIADAAAGAEFRVIGQILQEFEAAGDAMRYLNADGQIGWKATPAMLTRLGDAEQEVIDDLED